MNLSPSPKPENPLATLRRLAPPRTNVEETLDKLLPEHEPAREREEITA
jgi:hypothetical protein